MLEFKTIEDVYEAFDKVGCCSFATLDGKGGVESRIAHFFAWDDEGLYLRTMSTKPFYRQLVEGGKLTVCGEFTEARCVMDDDHMPHFQPGFTVRASGDVRELSQAEVNEKAKGNSLFNVAVHDIGKYPETRVFVLHRGHAELFDYDFNMAHRDHKLLRDRMTFGGEEWEPAGLHIDSDRCIACGSCEEVCTYKAIVPGEAYSILGERCDECGNCYQVCPMDAVVGKGLS